MPIVEGSNSFIALADANEYFKMRIGVYSGVWEAAADGEREAALVTATKRICRVPVRGIKVNPAQALSFPRAYLSNSLPVSVSQYNRQLLPGYYSETEVPQAVKDATCEEALALLAIGNSERLQLQQQGVSSFSLSGLSENYSPNAGKSMLLSKDAKDLLAPYSSKAVRIC